VQEMAEGVFDALQRHFGVGTKYFANRTGDYTSVPYTLFLKINAKSFYSTRIF
jgi:hypothetical protein